jgi:superfamily I DNA/RNA helicase
VRTVAAWWRDLLARCGVEYDFVKRMSEWRLERAFEQAWNAIGSAMRAQIEARGGWSHVVDSLKEKFGKKASGRWKSEFGDVMSSACMGDTGRYMRIDRSAREHDLSQVERLALAQIYSAYFAELERQGKTMFFRLPLLALELLECKQLDKCPAYREIVIDEAQELSKVDLYVISQIAAEAGADLVLLGDEDQATYADFSWDELELAGDKPERINLFNSYRTPANIIEQAENVLKHPLPKAQPTGNDGGHLRLVLCDEEEWTITALVDRVRELLGTGVPANQIAVIVPDKIRMNDCKEALSKHWQIDAYRDEEGRTTGLRLEEESIKLISYQSCGGFEFDHVIAMRVERRWFPGTKQRYHAGVNFDAWCHRKRRHLHVAMTRARKSLSMVCRREYKSFFLDDLDMAKVDLTTYAHD